MIINHVGMIPDGNRRWAKKNKMSLLEAYFKFINHNVKVIEYFFENGVKEVSLYLLSKKNLLRDVQDVKSVETALVKFIEEDCKNLSNKGITIVHAGKENINLLSDELRTAIENFQKQNVQKKAKAEKKLNILIGYNPIDEINNSIKDGKLDFKDLSVNNPVDILIRTATCDAPMRLSDFLPLQCAWSMFYDTKKYFLDTKLKFYKKILSKASKLVARKGK